MIGAADRRPAFRWIPALVTLLAVSGCAATSYLETSGPLYRSVPPADPLAAGDSLAAGGAPTPAAHPAPGPSEPIRVVSFNIEYAIEIDRAIELLTQEPALQRPDLLCLQEMDLPGTERIAKALGLNYVYAPSGVHRKSGRDFGCALLSPWPLECPRKLLLPHGARLTGLRRSAVAATMVRGGQRVLVYSLHLPSPLGISGGARRDQVARLAADVDSVLAAGGAVRPAASGATGAGAAGGAAAADTAGNRIDSVILAGDFNSHGVCEEFLRFGFGWPTRDSAPSAELRMLGVRLLHLRFDQVLTRGLVAAPGPDSVGVIADNRDASDHQPVWARLVPGAAPVTSSR